MPSIPCPYCLDASDMFDAPGEVLAPDPSTGDIAFCWYCREFSMFASPLSRRVLTSEERTVVLADSKAKRILKVSAKAETVEQFLLLMMDQ